MLVAEIRPHQRNRSRDRTHQGGMSDIHDKKPRRNAWGTLHRQLPPTTAQPTMRTLHPTPQTGHPIIGRDFLCMSNCRDCGCCNWLGMLSIYCCKKRMSSISICSTYWIMCQMVLVSLQLGCFHSYDWARATNSRWPADEHLSAKQLYQNCSTVLDSLDWDMRIKVVSLKPFFDFWQTSVKILKQIWVSGFL